jgi:hypothetical protein
MTVALDYWAVKKNGMAMCVCYWSLVALDDGDKAIVR